MREAASSVRSYEGKGKWVTSMTRRRHRAASLDTAAGTSRSLSPSFDVVTSPSWTRWHRCIGYELCCRLLCPLRLAGCDAVAVLGLPLKSDDAKSTPT